MCVHPLKALSKITKIPPNSPVPSFLSFPHHLVTIIRTHSPTAGSHTDTIHPFPFSSHFRQHINFLVFDHQSLESGSEYQLTNFQTPDQTAIETHHSTRPPPRVQHSQQRRLLLLLTSFSQSQTDHSSNHSTWASRLPPRQLPGSSPAVTTPSPSARCGPRDASISNAPARSTFSASLPSTCASVSARSNLAAPTPLAASRSSSADPLACPARPPLLPPPSIEQARRLPPGGPFFCFQGHFL